MITAGGIHGRIVELGDTVVTLEIASGVKIRIEKSMIYPSAEQAQDDAANLNVRSFGWSEILSGTCNSRWVLSLSAIISQNT